MKLWKKQTVRWTKEGKNVPKGTKDSTKNTISSKRFYGTLKMASGKSKQIPLSEDEESSKRLLQKRQDEEDKKKILGITERDENGAKSLLDFLKLYRKVLESRGNSSFHVHRTIDCIESILKEAKKSRLNELTTSSVENVLAFWRKHGRPNKRGRKMVPLSICRSNIYARAIKGFTRWLWIEEKFGEDVLRSLKLLNADVDRRHKRRALTTEDIQTLLKTLQQSDKTFKGITWKFTPVDREMLYLLAMGTGLRGSELSSLKTHSFDLEKGTVTVEAAYSKRFFPQSQ